MALDKKKKTTGKPSTRERQHLRTNSIGALAREFYENGRDAAGDVLAMLPQSPKAEIFFRHLRPSDGQLVERTEPGAESTVKYFKFDPPPDWENPYQVMQVEVDSTHPTEYLSHTGEEYLLPFEGPGVEYSFYYSEPGSGSMPKEKKMLVKCGRVIRITAEVPHSAGGAGDTSTRAWMITRPIQESAPSVYLDPTTRKAEKPISDGPPDWSDPAFYSLRAWGISEQIRLQRVRNNLRIKDVADRIGINPSQLSKIEEAKKYANPSLETLKRIADVLDLDIADLISPPARDFWLSPSIRYENSADRLGRTPLFQKEATRKRLIEKQDQKRLRKQWNDHFVHLQQWCFSKGQSYDFPTDELGDLRWSSSWIIFEGFARLDIEFEDEIVSEAVLTESVVHVRGGGPRMARIEALEDTVIVQVNYSRDPRGCNCRDADEADLS